MNMNLENRELKFLCDSHRGALSEKSSLAINCWQNGFDTGQLFHDQQLWREALPHLGCAFESAEIMISTQAIERSNAYEIFTQSAILLADTFMQLEYVDRGREICLLSITRFEKELNIFPEIQGLIKAQLDILYQSVRQLDVLLLGEDGELKNDTASKRLYHCSSFIYS